MRSKHYLIPLKPLAWRRAGLSGTKFFDTQIKEKIAYGLYLNRCHGSDPIFDGPVEISVTFFMPTAQKKGKSGYHYQTPDLDNLVKLLLDAIVSTNTIVSDDRIISVIKAQKVYDKVTRTEFTIRELE